MPRVRHVSLRETLRRKIPLREHVPVRRRVPRAARPPTLTLARYALGPGLSDAVIGVQSAAAAGAKGGADLFGGLQVRAAG